MGRRKESEEYRSARLSSLSRNPFLISKKSVNATPVCSFRYQACQCTTRLLVRCSAWMVGRRGAFWSGVGARRRR